MFNLDDRPISTEGSICSEDFDDSISNVGQHYDEANGPIYNNQSLTGCVNSVRVPIPYSRSLDPGIIARLDLISEMLTCLVNELRDLPRDVYGHTHLQDKALPDFSRHMGARHDMSRKQDVDNHKVHSGTMYDLTKYVLRE